MTGGPPPLLVEGVRLFNDGRYFEAHEVLEKAWLAEAGELRDLYQGLLQVGVGLHHLLRGNRRGAVRLLRRGCARLHPFAPRRLGLEVGALVAAAEVLADRIEGPEGLEAAAGPLPRAILAPTLPGHRGAGPPVTPPG